jgi:hypothetical protein
LALGCLAARTMRSSLASRVGGGGPVRGRGYQPRESPGSRSGRSAWPSLVSPRLSTRDVRTGPRYGLLEVLPAAGRRGVTGVIDIVVVVELPAPLLRDQPEKADVWVGHDHAPSPGNVIETAVA